MQRKKTRIQQQAAKEEKNAKTQAAAALLRKKTLRRGEDGGEITFIVIQKNVTSLCSSDRVEELAREVCDCRWDALLISESWSPGKAELWMTLQGQIYMGAGRFPNKHGVRKLLNRRWNNKTNWTDCISERPIAVSITVNNQSVLLMSVYTPTRDTQITTLKRHTEQPRNTSNQRSTFKSSAETSTLSKVFALGLERSSVCRYTLNDGNKRGDSMKQWVMLQRFAQSTQCTEKRPRNKQRT